METLMGVIAALLAINITLNLALLQRVNSLSETVAKLVQKVGGVA